MIATSPPAARDVDEPLAQMSGGHGPHELAGASSDELDNERNGGAQNGHESKVHEGNGWATGDQLTQAHHREALEAWCLELVSPTTGHGRKAYACYGVITRAVGPAIVRELISNGLLAVWDLGPGPRVTPFGLEHGKFLTLTPFSAWLRNVRLAERLETAAIVGYRVRQRRKPAEEVQWGSALQLYWESAAKPEPPIIRRRQHAPSRWMELIADSAPGPGDL
jgi:hypothetical protein